MSSLSPRSGGNNGYTPPSRRYQENKTDDVQYSDEKATTVSTHQIQLSKLKKARDARGNRRGSAFAKSLESVGLGGLISTSKNNEEDMLAEFNDEDDDNERKKDKTLMGIKLDSLIRFFKVATAFPFIIVVASIQLSNKYNVILRSAFVIRGMNLSMYILPFILVRIILSKLVIWVQKLCIAVYLLLYLFPVGSVIFAKISFFSSNAGMGEGTFCFKPARYVRFTQANFWAIVGFFFEWLQHITYVMPLGIVTKQEQTLMKDYPPYLPFDVYFWFATASAFLCGIILILNASLSGKMLYNFRSTSAIWFFIYNLGSPMYMTIVTILFMGLNCDNRVDPPTMIQNPDVVCYSPPHVTIANAALIAIAIYLTQNTLLPTGTYKETMGENDLDIMFVPVYLQAHYLCKAILCYIYVFFYRNDYVRCVVLTFINILLLVLNNNMKPCSVEWVNSLRDTIFIHASLSGIQSLNYLVWPSTVETKSMLLSTLSSNIFFITICMYAYHAQSVKTPEYTIAKSFLDLEWQVSHGGTVQARVLEQLISLTLSVEPEDWIIAENYVPQLVWLISYPNMRVQFQSSWALANLALLTEKARLKIHDAGGTKSFFEWFSEMDFVVQLESLACLANLTLSDTIALDMVNRFKCIPFLISLISSNKMLHSRFSSIALSNLTRTEYLRNCVRAQGGIPILIGNLMSSDVSKRKFGLLGLANFALSKNGETEQLFLNKTVLKRVISIAFSNEIETQKECIALLRNLSCHANIRPTLLERGMMLVIERMKTSVFDEVHDWIAEAKMLMDKDVSLKALELRAQAKTGDAGKFMDAAFLRSLEDDAELLDSFPPLLGKVEWSTWGSKLDNIFSLVFATLPVLTGIELVVQLGDHLKVNFAATLPKGSLDRWRGNMAYEIVSKPSHGKLIDFSPTNDIVTYVPDERLGQDFFAFTIKLGGVTIAPATISIKVVKRSKEGP